MNGPDDTTSTFWDRSGADYGINRGTFGDGIAGSFCGANRTPTDDDITFYSNRDNNDSDFWKEVDSSCEY